MKFNKDFYIKKFINDGVVSSLEYLTSVQPKKLYKFFSLDTLIDDLKLSTLKEDKIWVDLFCNQNDPFEMVNLNIDKRTVNDKYNKNGELIVGKDNLVEAYQKFIDKFKSSLKIASFVQTMESNIAMWAYYANNHKGYCCEYEIINNDIRGSTILKPVIYNKSMIKINDYVVEQLLVDALNGLRASRGEIILRDTIKDEMIKFYASFKYISWKHEKEYRGFYFGKENGKGENVKCSDLNVKLKAIYSGVNCSKINKRRLKEIADELKVSFYELKINCDNFTLIK